MGDHCASMSDGKRCRSCDRIPVVISLRGDMVAPSYPDFKRAVALACELRPGCRLTFDLKCAENIEALAGMFVMEVIMPHREMSLVLANIPSNLAKPLAPLAKALCRWIKVSAVPIQLRGPDNAFRRVASFKGQRLSATWKYGVYCAEVH